MDWKERYADKIRTAEEAVKLIKSGDYVTYNLDPGATPMVVTIALANRWRELEDVKLQTTFTLAAFAPGFSEPGAEKAFHMYTGFAMTEWEAAKIGQNDPMVEYVPDSVGHPFYGSGLWTGKGRDVVQRRFRSPDVFLCQVSPPDSEGICTFNSWLWDHPKVAENAKMVIAEVWDDAPVVYGGDNHIHVDHIDYLVPSQAIPWPPPQLEAMLVTPAEEVGPFEVIGAYLAEEIIDDGDTLMTGAGADRYESMLMNKVDLGCHCETVPPMDLIMAGVVTNKRRNFCTGKTSLTSITTMRTPEQRKFVNDNPHLFDIRLVEKINNPVYLAQNDNLVGVNTCVEIDLKSHISVERVGYRMFHGVGGQFELIQGCLLSRGGRSCHCVLSTKAHGTVSTIVPELSPKSLATINPATADFVITEYGIASLMGRTERERANELIAVAHPDFRPWLRGEAKKMFG